MAPLRTGIISIGRATPEHNVSHLIGWWPDIDLVMIAQDSSVNYDYNGTGQVRVASRVWLLCILLCISVYASYYIGLLIDFFREEERELLLCISTYRFDTRNLSPLLILLRRIFCTLIN